MYAVNLMAIAELTRKPANLALWLVLRDFVTETEIQTLPGMQHASLLVRDEIGPERWQAMVAIIRSRFSYPAFPMYEKTQGYWRAER